MVGGRGAQPQEYAGGLVTHVGAVILVVGHDLAVPNSFSPQSPDVVPVRDSDLHRYGRHRRHQNRRIIHITIDITHQHQHHHRSKMAI